MKVLGMNFRKSARYGALLEEHEDGGHIHENQLVLPVAAIDKSRPESIPSGERTPQETRDLVAMTPKSCSLAIKLKGDWVKMKKGLSGKTKEGEYMATISGSQLTWYTGEVASLEISQGQISLRLNAKTYYAELGSDGLLRWSDGDVWVLKDSFFPSSWQQVKNNGDKDSSSQFQRLWGNKGSKA